MMQLKKRFKPSENISNSTEIISLVVFSKISKRKDGIVKIEINVYKTGLTNRNNAKYLG